MSQDLDIQEAINEQIRTLALPTAWPNEAFDPPEDSYLDVTYITSSPEDDTWGGKRQIRFCQVSVYTESGAGATPLYTLVGQVIDLFPFNSEFTSEGVTVTIDGDPWAAQGLNDNQGRFFVPVTIPLRTNK